MMVRWETVGILVGHGGLLLGLRCDARNSRLQVEPQAELFWTVQWQSGVLCFESLSTCRCYYCCCSWRLSTKGLLETDPCERQHSFEAGGKNLEEWKRTALRLGHPADSLTKGIPWVCGEWGWGDLRTLSGCAPEWLYLFPREDCRGQLWLSCHLQFTWCDTRWNVEGP